MTLAEKIQESTTLLNDLRRALRETLEQEVRDCAAACGEDGTLTMYLEQVFKLAKKGVMEGETLKDRLFASCAAIVVTQMLLEIKADEAGE